MSIEPGEAAASLGSVHDARRRLTHSAGLGWGVSLVAGCLVGWLIATQALPGRWWTASFLAFLAVCSSLQRWQRRRIGLKLREIRRGRTLRVGLLMLAFFVLLVALADWLTFSRHAPILALWLGVAAAVPTALLYQLWARMYALDLSSR